MKKKQSTSELLDWLKLLLAEDIGPETLRERDPKKLIPPLHGALIKNEQDVHLVRAARFSGTSRGAMNCLSWPGLSRPSTSFPQEEKGRRGCPAQGRA
jgi:hypothetical protein